MHYDIEKIEGVGRAYGRLLRIAGITTTAQLLAKARTPRQRTTLAVKAGIHHNRILDFANRADLMELDGIGEEYSDCLELAGVDTVPELAQRRADHLLAAIEEAVASGRIIRRMPTLKEVRAWIREAKKTGRRLEY